VNRPSIARSRSSLELRRRERSPDAVARKQYCVFVVSYLSKERISASSDLV
jgi:hypothetical protein